MVVLYTVRTSNTHISNDKALRISFTLQIRICMDIAASSNKYQDTAIQRMMQFGFNGSAYSYFSRGLALEVCVLGPAVE